MVNKIIFDKSIYPIAWRLNSSDCHLSLDEKKNIVLLNGDESEKLWDLAFPFNILMDIKPSQYHIIEKKELSFDEIEKSALFFHEKLKETSDVIFFWGRRASAIIFSPENIAKAWDDFFILVTNQVLFTYQIEETLFFLMKKHFFMQR